MKAITAIFFSLLSTILLNVLAGTAVAFATGWDPGATLTGTFVVSGLITMVNLATGVRMPGGLFTITITDILSQYGSYYLNHGQNQADILRAFKRTRSLPSYAAARVTEDTIARLSNAFMSQVLQGFHKTYSHKGDASFIPNTIQLRRIKVDQTLTPDDVVESWMGFLTNLNETERQNWPIVRYIWEVLIAEQAQADYEHADWAGDYNAAPGGGTPNSHLEIYDGLRKQIIDGLALSGNYQMNDLTAAIGAFDPSDPTEVFDALEAIAGSEDGVPVYLASRAMDVWVPQSMLLAYQRDRRNVFNALESRAGGTYGPVPLDFLPNWRLVPFGGMDVSGDSANLFVTPRGNVLHYTKAKSFNLGMDKVDRTAKLYADWMEGLGFGVNKLVWAYIPEDSGSASAI